jgi:alkylation response protein AidB-like acyl-CoA dehydrogenase
MADLSLSPEQVLLRNTARDFIERECKLLSVREIVESEAGFSQDLWHKTAELGWQGLLVPQEFGGSGGSLTDAAALFEELGRGCMPGPYVSTALAALLFSRGGSDGQRETLRGIASGERAFAFAAAQRGTVSLQGSTLNGTLVGVPDASAATDLLCQSPDGELLALDRNSHGVSLRHLRAFAGEKLSDVELRDVELPNQSAICTNEQARPAIDAATALLCAYMAGATRRVYEMSMAYAQQRVQFGQPIARFQRVQDRLIEMLNAADAARWTAYEAVWKLENEKPDAALAVSVAKAAASEGFYRACEDAHHVHAGIGSEKGYGLYLYTMKSRSLYHYLGDPAHHRKRIAELLLDEGAGQT